MTKSLDSSRKGNRMGWDEASLASLTSWPVIQPTHTHTTLTIRMHFNFPPCCVHTHRTTYYIAEGGHGRESATSSSSSSSNCCKSAKPQMLSVTQKSTLSPPHLPSTPTQQTTHQTNPPQSVPFPALPCPSLPTLCTHSMPSTKLFNLLAIYYGSSLWDYRAASWNKRGVGKGGR